MDAASWLRAESEADLPDLDCNVGHVFLSFANGIRAPFPVVFGNNPGRLEDACFVNLPLLLVGGVSDSAV